MSAQDRYREQVERDRAEVTDWFRSKGGQWTLWIVLGSIAVWIVVGSVWSSL